MQLSVYGVNALCIIRVLVINICKYVISAHIMTTLSLGSHVQRGLRKFCLSVCLLPLQLTLQWFVWSRNDTTYSAHNKNQFKCRILCENVLLPRQDRYPHSMHTDSWSFLAENTHSPCPCTVSRPATQAAEILKCVALVLYPLRV